ISSSRFSKLRCRTQAATTVPTVLWGVGTPHECAYNECYNCQRGGHRTKNCQFPKYP
ncbi:unnamed protein product, partial [Scytosiphon promiscuus]